MAAIYCGEHKFESIQAILFDKDGTLANVEAYLWELGMARSQAIPDQTPAFYTNLLATFGLTKSGIDPAGLIAVASRQEDQIATAACLATTGKGWIEACAIAKAALDQADLALAPKVEKTPLLAGVIPMLSQLSKAGVKLGIVSSDQHLEVATFIEFYKLPGVDWYCGASQQTPHKTHPGFLAFACQNLQVDPAATLIVGDSASDFSLAKQGAADFLGMIGGWSQTPMLGPTIKTFSALSQIVVSA